MVVVVLALVSSLAYGVSDLFGAAASRRLPVLTVTTVSYLVAAVVLSCAALVLPGEVSLKGVGAGLAAGGTALLGFVTFYAALAAGPVGVTSPLIAMLQSAVPVAVAVVLGEGLSARSWVGVFAAIGAAVLLGMPGERGGHRVGRRAVALSIVSGVSLGASVCALGLAPAAGGLVPVTVEELSGVTILAGVTFARRRWWAGGSTVGWLDGHAADLGATTAGHGSWSLPVIGLSVGTGVLLGFGNALLVVALHGGALSIVAVLVGLYPLTTILAARVFFAEHLSATQYAGVAVALGAGVALALG